MQFSYDPWNENEYLNIIDVIKFLKMNHLINKFYLIIE